MLVRAQLDVREELLQVLQQLDHDLSLAVVVGRAQLFENCVYHALGLALLRFITLQDHLFERKASFYN